MLGRRRCMGGSRRQAAWPLSDGKLWGQKNRTARVWLSGSTDLQKTESGMRVRTVQLKILPVALLINMGTVDEHGTVG